MKGVLGGIIVSCKKSTELMEKQSVLPLSIKEKFQLFLHKSWCSTCNAYYESSKKIDDSLGQFFNVQETKNDHHLSESSKASILEKIKKLEK